jgi:hypothetical protein
MKEKQRTLFSDSDIVRAVVIEFSDLEREP